MNTLHAKKETASGVVLTRVRKVDGILCVNKRKLTMMDWERCLYGVDSTSPPMDDEHEELACEWAWKECIGVSAD